MKRTTIKLPDELDTRLRREAERRGMTISQLSREAIDAYLGGGPGRRRLRIMGAGNSGRSDISQRVDELLEEWGFGEDN
jgi:Ribbon-helix-helix protein, copG family